MICNNSNYSADMLFESSYKQGQLDINTSLNTDPDDSYVTSEYSVPNLEMFGETRTDSPLLETPPETNRVYQQNAEITENLTIEVGQFFLNNNNWNRSADRDKTQSAILIGKENQLSPRKPRTSRRVLDQMSNIEIRLMKKAENRRNSQRCLLKKKENKQSLEKIKSELSCKKANLMRDIEKNNIVKQTHEFIQSKFPGADLKTLEEEHHSEMGKVDVSYNNNIDHDLDYISKKDAFSSAEEAYQQYATGKNRGDEKGTTYNSRKCRAKAAKLVCELDRDVALLRFEVERLEGELTVVLQTKSKYVEVFKSCFNFCDKDAQHLLKVEIALSMVEQLYEFVQADLSQMSV